MLSTVGSSFDLNVSSQGVKLHLNQGNTTKGHSAFPWISAQPLLDPLLNMHATSYMSVIMYPHMLPYQQFMKQRSYDNGWANPY